MTDTAAHSRLVTDAVDTDLLATSAAALLDGVVELRRAIHVHPELGLHLPRTQEAVLAALGPLGL
jgi:metal-dependent amidase/aminoacylase/carboxypeptidase family protein